MNNINNIYKDSGGDNNFNINFTLKTQGYDHGHLYITITNKSSDTKQNINYYVHYRERGDHLNYKIGNLHLYIVVKKINTSNNNGNNNGNSTTIKSPLPIGVYLIIPAIITYILCKKSKNY